MLSYQEIGQGKFLEFEGFSHGINLDVVIYMYALLKYCYAPFISHDLSSISVNTVSDIT